MTHPLNAKRADACRRTLDKSDYASNGQDFVTGMVDLLSDMMHCVEQQTGEDFDDLVRQARNNYESERGEGDDIEQDMRRLEAQH